MKNSTIINNEKLNVKSLTTDTMKETKRKKLNRKSPWLSNQSILELNIYQLTNEQKQLIIKQSKLNLENSLFQSHFKGNWNKIITQHSKWLSFSIDGVSIQKKWIQFKNQMNLQEYITYVIKSNLNIGVPPIVIYLLLCVFSGEEIGHELVTQLINDSKELQLDKNILHKTMNKNN